jgi:hypothetical protein
VTFIDDFTRFATATPIKTKSMVLESFKEFKVMFEKQLECTVKCFHSKNGGEYTPVEKYAKKAGKAVTRSAPYTPQANGVAERMNRTLIESVRATLLCSPACRNRFGRKHWLTPSQSRIGIRATMVKVPTKYSQAQSRTLNVSNRSDV